MRTVLRLRNARPLEGSFEGLAEEQRALPSALDLEPPEVHELEKEGEEKVRKLPPEPSPRRVFSVFIDGVQRSVRVGTVRSREGAEAPVYLAWIAAGAAIRMGRTLRMGPRRIWRVLAAPFRLLGEDPAEMLRDLREQGEQAIDQRETIERPEALLEPASSGAPGWILADTSQAGIAGGGSRLDDLFNERRVRNWALGRIAHLRQLLELAMLIGIRAASPSAPPWLRALALPELKDIPDLPEDPAVLVDGPLLLARRHRRMLHEWAQRQGYRPGEGDPERTLLGRAVGLVKSHRLRPKDLPTILSLPEGHRSRAYAFSQEVDIHGRALEEDMRSDEDHLYPDWHVTAYVRLRRRPGFSLEGLVRIDLHRWALHPGRDEIPTGPEPLNQEEQEALDDWAAAVYRERRPRTEREQPYPISVLERILHARLPPAPAIARSLRLVSA